MIEVIVVGEGQTEETFIRDVLAPAFFAHDLFLHPRLIATSPHAGGGAISRDRLLRYVRNTLRERGDTYVTTLFDLHGLRADFPGVHESREQRDPIVRCRAIEAEFERAAIDVSGCREDRFIAHVQPYEFEALLFSDVACFATLRPEWVNVVDSLREVRSAVESPEHINDGPDTHPSARLRKLQPPYRKVLHGSGIAKCIGIQRIREECRHFHSWLQRIETLPPLR